MLKRKTSWILLISVGIMVLGLAVLCGLKLLEFRRLAALTYLFSGYNIFAQPSFDIPRLPPAEDFDLVDHLGGTPSDIVVEGKFAYVGYGSNFVTVDISDPERPHIAGQLTLLSPVRDVAVSGSTAFVADGRGGLRVVDISDPAHPRERSKFGYRAAIQSVDCRGNTVYLAGGVEGVQILDCDDPSKPRLTRFRDQSREKYGVLDSTELAVVDTYLFVSNGGNELRVMDLSQPEWPQVVQTIDLKQASGVTLSADGNLCAVGSTSPYEGLWLYKVENGTGLFVSSVPVSKFGGAMVLKDGYLYLGASEGLVIIDARNPGAPMKLGEAKTNSSLIGIDASNDRVYATTYAGDFISFDISNKKQPKVIGVMNEPGEVAAVASDSKGLIVASRYGSLFAFTQKPNGIIEKEPRLLGTCSSPNFVSCFENSVVIEHDKYTGPNSNDDWLQISRVKPGSKLVDQIDVAVPGANLCPVFTTNSIAVGGYDGVHTVPLSSSERDPKATFLALKRGAEAVASHDRWLFVGADKDAKAAEIQVYDASNEKLRLVQSVTVNESVTGLCAAGNYLYATVGPFLGKNQLVIFDISDPAKIKRVSSIDSFGGTTIAVDGGIVYMEEVAHIKAIDVSDPLKPVVVGKIETTAVPMSVRDLRARDGLLYVVAGDAGLYVYRLKSRRASQVTR